MRLGLFIYGALETLSGGYLYDRQLVAHLRAAGAEVELISIPWRHYAAHLTDNLDRALARRLSAGRWEVLLQDELNHPSLFWRNTRLRAPGAPPIVSIVHHLRGSEHRPGWQNAFYRPVERAYLRSVDGFLFNSATTRAAVTAALGGVLAQPGLIAHPAADHVGPPLDPAAIAARADAPGPVRLLFVGNVIPRKGLHTVLTALARVRGEWRLTVVGSLTVDPAYAAHLRTLAAPLGERVQFLGAASDAAVRAHLAAHHVLVVPSSYEGFGIVYLEALAFGLPVIATTAGAAGEIITSGREGLLVPPESPAALAPALQALLDDRARVRQMGLAARERYAQWPTWAESFRPVLSFLATLPRRV